MNTLPTPTLFSDNADDVCRELTQAENRVLEIEREIERAEAAGDDDAYVELSEAFHVVYSAVVDLQRHIEELEDREARQEERSLRSWIRWASL